GFYLKKCFSLKSNEEQPSFASKFSEAEKCFWLDGEVEIFSFSTKKCFWAGSFTFLATHERPSLLSAGSLPSSLPSAGSLFLCPLPSASEFAADRRELPIAVGAGFAGFFAGCFCC
ncbi:hypothetical protein ES319_D02G224300v1, partial [Gossypium barbadense]